MHEHFTGLRKASFCGFDLVFHVCYIYSHCESEHFVFLSIFAVS